MKTFLLIVEFTSSVALIVAILIHSAKGEGLGGIGGQARVFGTQKGLESGLDKVTAVLAAIFLITACILGLYF